MNNSERCKIVVQLQVEGLHCWEGCNIQSVDFLRHPHRHIFHIRCEKTVMDEDREIEIIMFKRSIATHLSDVYGTPCDFGGMSCEMIASELVRVFGLSSCEVLEDGENGAIVERV